MAHPDATIIWGAKFDENLEDAIRVTVVATGLGDSDDKKKKDVDLAQQLGGMMDTKDEDESYTDLLNLFNQ
jgi:cell division GTPase FtsZ